MKTLIMTVGLPQTGKSTWARTRHVPMVNGDSVRLALHGQPFIVEAEPMVSCVQQLMVRALFIAGHDVVILDGTHTTRASRDRWISSQWERIFVLTGGPEMLETSIARAYHTCRDSKHLEDLTGAIKRMAENYQVPQPDEPVRKVLHLRNGRVYDEERNPDV